MTEARGEIYDIGYQHYDGPREGRARARKALWTNGVRTALGLGRRWTAKVLPALLFVALLIPALLFILLNSITGSIVDVPGHAEYYEAASVTLFIFSAIIAPELLCADRRSGVISLYLVRPLSPTDYVVGRWLAFFTVTLTFVLLPQFILLTGLTLGAEDPLRYLIDTWLVVPRFLAAGLALTLLTTTLPLAVAGFTTRRVYASAVVIGLWLISTAVGGVLTEAFEGGTSRWAALIAIGSVPIYINEMIFGATSDSELARAAAELPRAAILAWYAAVTVGPGLLLWWRYQRLRV